MDKMKMETPDFTKINVEKIAEMFPNVMTEAQDEQGNLVRKIDFEKLKQELSSNIIDGDESYDFTWVGKKQAMIEANKPINKTLRPCREDSLNWKNTENLYIEGDNLEVLKLLQESYLNKVKMIYIDPPYNTGNDSFIYPDDYATNKDKYDEEVGAIDESGYRMFKNTETNGRFHSSWCSMMYPRLKLARNLLSDDGVIFISIDDHEVDNLKKICDEVFGESNFLYQLSVVNNLNGNDNSSGMMETQEFCLLYAKDKAKSIIGVLPLEGEDSSDWKIDEVGYWKIGRCLKATGINAPREARPNLFFPVYINENTLEFTVDETVGADWYHLIPLTEGKEMSWYWSKETFKNESNEVIVKKTNEGYSLYKKQRPSLGDMPSKRGKTTFYSPKYANANSNAEIKKLFDGRKLFDYSKSTQLIKDFICLGNTASNDIILDFFSGSATTAHAVMQLNAEDGGKRKFIMVQLPEICDEKSEAKKAGFDNICEIGKERIRRAGKKIVEETGKTDLDVGFRVFKLDESNMKEVYYKPDDYNQSMLEKMTSNIKEDRTPEDLLYACMLDWGLELSLPHSVEKIDGFDVHIVNDGDLIACFDEKISEDAIKQIADKKPLRVVFRDSSFANDAARVNVGEIFKLKSPNTTVKVI